jgi:hypothetical protein
MEQSTPKRISTHELRNITMFDFLEHIESMMSPYEAKQGESKDQRMDRWSRTLDEMPDIYAWFNHCFAVFDWLTDRCKELYGQSDSRYREARQRRDAAEKAASSAKLRYQGASRQITIAIGVADEAQMSRHRY